MTKREMASLTTENVKGEIRSLEELLANVLVEWDGSANLNKIGTWKNIGALVALRRVLVV